MTGEPDLAQAADALRTALAMIRAAADGDDEAARVFREVLEADAGHAAEVAGWLAGLGAELLKGIRPGWLEDVQGWARGLG